MRLKLAIFILSMLSVFLSSAQSLCINEVQVANIDQYIDPSYNYGGWIELYNPGSKAVNLKGYLIRHTDPDGNIEIDSLLQAHGSIPALGYAVVWFDHNSSDGYYGSTANSQIHYKLDADGGVIELLDKKGKLVDAVSYPPCIARCSWMRVTDGGPDFGWTNHATPNASNNTTTTCSERLSSPTVSATGGIFRGSYIFGVDIPDGCTLHYTTDGSTPIAGQSKVSKNGVFYGTENARYRFMLTAEGYLNSPVMTRSFFLQDATYCLPVLSVNTAPKNLFDNTIGLYVTGTNGRNANNSKKKANQNMDWERPVNVEYFTPDSAMNYEEAINQEATFSIFGGWTRFNTGNEDFEYRTSFKLKSDKVYEGQNSFRYPIFNSKPHIKIKNFLVRNGGQDSQARIWDAAIQELIRTSGVYLDCQAWQPAQVFLDGKYLGLMNLREESNKQFAFSNYGIEKDEIDQWEGDIIVNEGSRAKLNEWYNLSKQLANAPTDTTIWNRICQLVDIDEYCNYMAAETYMGNQDWLRGGIKNIKGFRAQDDDGKFHIVMHDVDGGFGYTDMLQQIYEKGSGTMPTRFKNMLMYEPFKKQFIDAYCLMNGSVFDPDRCTPIINAMREVMNPALALEGYTADTKADLLISRLHDNTDRRPALKQSLIKAFNLNNEYNVTLSSNVSEASLMLNGQEVPTGRFTGYLFPPIALASSAPAGFSFQGWRVNGTVASSDSILHVSENYLADTLCIEALYERTETPRSPIFINEVSAGNDIFINEYGKKADWIELYNSSSQDYDLAGAYLSDDEQDLHKFQIQPSDSVSTVVPAHGYSLIWCDGKASKSQLHASFKLKNDDECFISLTSADDTWTDSLRYKAQPRWYTYGRYPDGGQNVALFERPTISNANHLCTQTVLQALPIPTSSQTALVQAPNSPAIAAIRYYNLRGQQITDLNAERIVIQRIIYKDGTSKSRKVTNMPGI